jgi:hypothetical protein
MKCTFKKVASAVGLSASALALILPAHGAEASGQPPQTTGGVYTEVFAPANGRAEKNPRRVLINLHGGGFEAGSRTSSHLESVPIASLGQIKVISVDWKGLPPPGAVGMFCAAGSYYYEGDSGYLVAARRPNSQAWIPPPPSSRASPNDTLIPHLKAILPHENCRNS